MAFKDKDLLKPSILSLFAGLIVSIIFIPLMIGAGILATGENGLLGQVTMVVATALMVFFQYAVGYVFSAMTVYLVYGYLAEGDGIMSKAWAVAKRDFFDLLSLAAASTAVNLVKNAHQGQGHFGRPQPAGRPGGHGLDGSGLPASARHGDRRYQSEGRPQARGLHYQEQPAAGGLSAVGIKAVNGLIGFLVSLLGIGLGFAVGYGIISLAGIENVAGLVSGIGLGVFISGIFIMVAAVFTSYTATAYHTCLYLWARDVEKAQAAGSTAEVPAPAPLAAVLNK